MFKISWGTISISQNNKKKQENPQIKEMYRKQQKLRNDIEPRKLEETWWQLKRKETIINRINQKLKELNDQQLENLLMEIKNNRNEAKIINNDGNSDKENCFFIKLFNRENQQWEYKPVEIKKQFTEGDIKTTKTR